MKRDGPARRLSGGRAHRRVLDAVVDRVSRDVHERRPERRVAALREAHVVASNGEPGRGLAQAGGEPLDVLAEAGEARGDRLVEEHAQARRQLRRGAPAATRARMRSSSPRESSIDGVARSDQAGHPIVESPATPRRAAQGPRRRPGRLPSEMSRLEVVRGVGDGAHVVLGGVALHGVHEAELLARAERLAAPQAVDEAPRLLEERGERALSPAMRRKTWISSLWRACSLRASSSAVTSETTSSAPGDGVVLAGWASWSA